MYHVQTTGYTRGQRQPKGLNIGFGYAHTTAQGNGIGGTIVAKYKFTLTVEKRNRVEADLRDYPEDKKQLEEMKEDLIPSQISQYGHREGSGFDSEKRPTEDITIRIVSAPYIRFLSWKVEAIDSVIDNLNEIDREILDMMYWHRGLTPEGIAMKLMMDKTTVYYRLNNILVEIARKLGYINL